MLEGLGRSLRRTWARCLISLFIARPLPSCRAGLPWAEAEGRSGSSSSAPDSSPSALPACHFLTSHPQSCAPLLSTRFAPEQKAPRVHSRSDTGGGKCCPAGHQQSFLGWDLVGGHLGAERLAITHQVTPDSVTMWPGLLGAWRLLVSRNAAWCTLGPTLSFQKLPLAIPVANTRCCLRCGLVLEVTC